MKNFYWREKRIRVLMVLSAAALKTSTAFQWMVNALLRFSKYLNDFMKGEADELMGVLMDREAVRSVARAEQKETVV